MEAATGRHALPEQRSTARRQAPLGLPPPKVASDCTQPIVKRIWVGSSQPRLAKDKDAAIGTREQVGCHGWREQSTLHLVQLLHAWQVPSIILREQKRYTQEPDAPLLQHSTQVVIKALELRSHGKKGGRRRGR